MGSKHSTFNWNEGVVPVVEGAAFGDPLLGIFSRAVGSPLSAYSKTLVGQSRRDWDVERMVPLGVQRLPGTNYIVALGLRRGFLEFCDLHQLSAQEQDWVDITRRNLVREKRGEKKTKTKTTFMQVECAPADVVLTLVDSEAGVDARLRPGQDRKEWMYFNLYYLPHVNIGTYAYVDDKGTAIVTMPRPKRLRPKPHHQTYGPAPVLPAPVLKPPVPNVDGDAGCAGAGAGAGGVSRAKPWARDMTDDEEHQANARSCQRVDYNVVKKTFVFVHDGAFRNPVEAARLFGMEVLPPTVPREFYSLEDVVATFLAYIVGEAKLRPKYKTKLMPAAAYADMLSRPIRSCPEDESVVEARILKNRLARISTGYASDDSDGDPDSEIEDAFKSPFAASV